VRRRPGWAEFKGWGTLPRGPVSGSAAAPPGEGEVKGGVRGRTARCRVVRRRRQTKK